MGGSRAESRCAECHTLDILSRFPVIPPNSRDRIPRYSGIEVLCVSIVDLTTFIPRQINSSHRSPLQCGEYSALQHFYLLVISLLTRVYGTVHSYICRSHYLARRENSGSQETWTQGSVKLCIVPHSLEYSSTSRPNRFTLVNRF